MEGIDRLHGIMARLRDPEKGCPWDKVQTLETLKPCVIEETYELMDAMDRPEDREGYIEELGDVLLQVVFQCAMAEERGDFTLDDVANAISDKLVRRHPHVFGDVKADDQFAVLKNWERIKQQERRKSLRRSALDGVPPVLPALLKAQRTQEKAARVGFDWKDASGPVEKIREEMSELEEAAVASSGKTADPRVKDELGDLLFSVANLARHLGCDAESALGNATAKFSRRFRAVEAAVAAKGGDMKDMSLQELDAIWDEVKKLETDNAGESGEKDAKNA